MKFLDLVPWGLFFCSRRRRKRAKMEGKGQFQENKGQTPSLKPPFVKERNRRRAH